MDISYVESNLAWSLGSPLLFGNSDQDFRFRTNRKYITLIRRRAMRVCQCYLVINASGTGTTEKTSHAKKARSFEVVQIPLMVLASVVWAFVWVGM